MKNIRNHRNMNFATTLEKLVFLVLKPNYHAAKLFPDNLSK